MQPTPSPKTISIGTVPSHDSDSSMDSNAHRTCSKKEFSCCHDCFASIGKTNPSFRRRSQAMSEKIKSQHIGRKALLYVRQSSTYQVNHNLESQKLQYAMR